ncbi:MAG: DUF1080 domain-containing protein [Phycisphaerae bacterium]
MAEKDHNTLTEEEKNQGWKLLFDGQSTEQWRGFRKDHFPEGWQVVDGTIHRVDKAGDIITKEQFGDFELQLDWKVAGPGNSGIFFHVSEDEDAVWKTGPEMQILNDDVHPDGKNPLTRVGSNYALHAPKVDACKPVGQWNHVRIVVKGPHVELWLNGQQTVEYELGSEDWEKRVAESKFSKFPNYGRLDSGHIALQDHSDPVWFRNIKILPLD